MVMVRLIELRLGVISMIWIMIMDYGSSNNETRDLFVWY